MVLFGEPWAQSKIQCDHALYMEKRLPGHIAVLYSICRLLCNEVYVKIGIDYSMQ